MRSAEGGRGNKSLQRALSERGTLAESARIASHCSSERHPAHFFNATRLSRSCPDVASFSPPVDAAAAQGIASEPNGLRGGVPAQGEQGHRRSEARSKGAADEQLWMAHARLSVVITCCASL
jgi:hypothetical protein